MRKTISILLAALMLAAALTGLSLAADDEREPVSLYIPVTGKVTSIDEYIGTDGLPVDGWYFIGLELDDDTVCVLFVTDKTCYPYESEIGIGDIVTGYYRSDMPMVMIYPPRYSVGVLVAGIPDSDTVKADRFTSREGGPEGYLVSDDNTLAITLGEDTAVMTPDGEPFEGELDGRALAVAYDVSTRSIPAKTTPNAVYVLPEIEVPEQEDEPAITENMPIVVNGEIIDAPEAFLEGDSIVMLPLRAVAEALGFTVTWDGAARTVTLDGGITLTIGSTSCVSGGRDIRLACAPVIVNDITYVPIRFFKDAAEMNNAYVFDGQIVIDRDGEVME